MRRRDAPRSAAFADAVRFGHEMAAPFILFESPGLVELAAYAGFELVVIDAMHTSFSSQTVESLVRAADAVDIPALVRVAPDDPHVMMRALEAGAAGLVVADMRTAADARRAVEAAKFPPLGGRGACPSVRAAWFQTRDEVEYQASVNANSVIVALVESDEAVRNADELLAVEAIDAYVVGPYDLSCSLGLPGQIHHPRVLRATEQFLAAGRRASKATGVHLFQPRDAARWREHGASLFTLSLTSLIRRAAEGAIAELRATSLSTVQEVHEKEDGR